MKVNKIWFKQALLVPTLARPSNKNAHDKHDKHQKIKQEIIGLLTSKRFVTFSNYSNIYYDNQLNCLWFLYGFKANAEDMETYVSKLKLRTFNHWQIPELSQLKTLTNDPLLSQHPKFSGNFVYTCNKARKKFHYKTAKVGSNAIASSTETQLVIPYHPIKNNDIYDFIESHALMPNNIEGITEKLQALYQLHHNGETATQDLVSLDKIKQCLLEGDAIRAKLPIIEEACLYDMAKGLWEIYQPEKPEGHGWLEINLEHPWEARNPEIDVSDGAVAIDFGTSSTVVALRNHGKTSLLRVGMNDFFKKPNAKDYENPTIMELINLPSLLASWQADAYRPLTQWQDFHFSHEALKHYQANEANQKIVSSMLTGIKQWPLKASKNQPLRVMDQETGTELEITAPDNQAINSTSPIKVSEHDQFDPIELYAYYLGLFINYRSNGLFLEYYMTFPVTYRKEVKDQIRTSFARGLQRSLPLSLINTPLFKRFSVTEEASEPASYAACALEELKIIPTLEGVAFAVFDFGGGTTDFDFGLYRLPNKTEHESGYEQVIENIGASGDTYLGGENLIAHLAYLTFQQNLEICRQHKIPFVCPPDADKFPGHEPFLDDAYMAQTNHAIIMSKVREIWEAFEWQTIQDNKNTKTKSRNRRQSDIIGDILQQIVISPDFNVDPEAQSFHPDVTIIQCPAELLNRKREKVSIEFSIDKNKLNHFLVQRIGQGVHRFLLSLKQAFERKQIQPVEIHVLLAGNSSRSILVQSVFSTLLKDNMVGWKRPSENNPENTVIKTLTDQIMESQYIVHRPPQIDPKHLYKPTAKTGVAIGLLKLIPGEPLLALAPQVENVTDDTPFQVFVGNYKKGVFKPALMQNGQYRHWVELGKPIRNAFVMVYSDSPESALGQLKRGNKSLFEKKFRFSQSQKMKVFAQITSATTIEICLAESLKQIQTKAPHKEVVELLL